MLTKVAKAVVKSKKDPASRARTAAEQEALDLRKRATFVAREVPPPLSPYPCLARALSLSLTLSLSLSLPLSLSLSLAVCVCVRARACVRACVRMGERETALSTRHARTDV
jgi:hypothetical protein